MKRRISAILLTAAFLVSLIPAAFAAGPFADVSASHWASQFIQRAAGEGWVSGTGGGRYSPSESLTAAQFLTMVSNTFFPGEADQVTVPGGAPWYARYWTVAQDHALTRDTSIQSQSDLGKKITRYDMAQVIMNVIAAQEDEVVLDTGDILKAQTAIADWASVPKDYRSAVSGAYALGILSGKTGGAFAGSDFMTRAEAATVLCNMMDAVLNGGSIAGPSQPEKPSEPEKPSQPETPAQPSASEFTAEVVRLVNVERAKEGLKPLATFDSLTEAAQIRAEEIITRYEHTRPDGRRCFTVLDETWASKNAGSMGENIYASPATPAAAVEGWMNSEGHRANIMNPKFTHIGVGYAPGGEWNHNWVQLFVSIPEDASTGNQPSQPSQPTQPTEPSQPSQPTADELTAEVVRLVNVERAKEGLAPLGTYDSLTAAAQIRAPEIITKFSHDRPDGTKCYTAMDETGAKDNAYTYGENIAAGNATAAATVEQWMNSPGHRANILNPNFTHIGVGYANSSSGYRHYWVQMFTGIRGGSSSGSGSNTNSTTPTTPTNPTTPSQGTQVTKLQFSSPIMTISTNHMCIVTLLDQNFQKVSGNVTWTNETPELITFKPAEGSVHSGSQTGTGYLTAEYQGQTARIAIRIIPVQDQISLSTLSTTMQVGDTLGTVLYVFSSSKYYTQDYTCTWSVDDPSIVSLEESTSNGSPSVRFTALKTGDAKITCRVTGTDGTTAESYCFVHVLG